MILPIERFIGLTRMQEERKREEGCERKQPYVILI